MTYQVFEADCLQILKPHSLDKSLDLTFLDPPFNQAKDYTYHDDNLPDEQYWGWMKEVCQLIYDKTSMGGALYFMQREKNSEFVLRCLRESGWSLQNF